MQKFVSVCVWLSRLISVTVWMKFGMHVDYTLD